MHFVILFAFLTSFPVAASEREEFFGTWGTARQCSGEPIKPGGTVLAAPFEITYGWIKHRQLWCRLSWYPVEQRENGIFTAADAICGEDTPRSYLLRMDRSGDQLTLRWSLTRSNGPLTRC